MKTNRFMLYLSFALPLVLLGCAKANLVKTGYFQTYDNLVAGGELKGLPDYYYVDPEFDVDRYRKVVITNFTSKPSKPGLLSGLTITELKNIKTDVPDTIAQSLEGQLFDTVERINIKIKKNNLKAIRKTGADAVLIGNISELRMSLGAAFAGGTLIAAQFEIKIIDLKTGREMVKIIDRNKTDPDKISMPLVRHLTQLLSKNTEGDTPA